MRECMENLRKEIREELMTDMAFICWQIWKARCEVVICKKDIDNRSVIFKIKRNVTEYYQYNKEMNTEGIRIKMSLNMEKWVAPEDGWVKLNCDGAFDVASKKAGIGIVIKNSEADIVDRKNCSFIAGNALQAEAFGC
ncbi:hypothetical protein CRYUN_Cryun19dG0020400 [Craigia yunnanensis]